MTFNSGLHLRNYIAKILDNNIQWRANDTNLFNVCNLIYENETKVARLITYAQNSTYNLQDMSDKKRRSKLNRYLKTLLAY